MGEHQVCVGKKAVNVTRGQKGAGAMQRNPEHQRELSSRKRLAKEKHLGRRTKGTIERRDPEDAEKKKDGKT